MLRQMQSVHIHQVRRAIAVRMSTEVQCYRRYLNTRVAQERIINRARLYLTSLYQPTVIHLG
jgi:hypothetical protein